MPESINETMVKALPFLIVPILVIVASMFLKTYFSREIVISFPFFILGLMVGFLFLVVHEYLHAVMYPKNAVVYIGIVPHYFAAVALSSYPLSRIRFVIMSLLPSLLGIIPIVFFWIMPPIYREVNGFLFGAAALGLTSPYPDYYNVFQVLKQTPSGCQIQFYKDDTYYIM